MSIASAFIGLFPYKFRVFAFEFFRDTKGYKGMALRYSILTTIAKKIGVNVSVFPNVYLLHTELLTIGDNVSIHPFCYIDAFGGLDIGSDVSIAHGVSILTFEHSYEDLSRNIKDGPIQVYPVKIADDVWFGAKAVVLGGVTVGSHSVIGAGAVVTKDVLANTVVVGVPAKEIKRL